MIYVIGGNRQQALDHINRKQLAPAQPIDHPDELRVLRAPEVVLVGTYLTRDDRQAFDALLEEIDATVRFEV